MPELTIKKPVGLIVAVISGAVALSAVAGIVASLAAPTPFWYLCGFEVITLCAAIFGMLLSLGCFADGPGLGLLCVVGAVVAGSFLGDLSTNTGNPLGGSVIRKLGSGGLVQISIDAFVAARFAAAAVLGLCAAWIVLRRRPRESLRSLLWGAALGVLMLAVLYVSWKARAPLANVNSFVRTIAMLAVGAIALGLFAASAHFTIRAFEFGRLGRGQPVPRG